MFAEDGSGLACDCLDRENNSVLIAVAKKYHSNGITLQYSHLHYILKVDIPTEKSVIRSQ